ncbi:MAG: transcriptional regulator, TetR family [Solirubrobacterales bacterium]|nr:transcriptional regulator, TetR family [Solirubrobacterales bacterium]
MSEPAYRRLENDERRRRLVELGERLFIEHSFDEISMARIAREAGVSKALLYHYFPSKQDFFVATLTANAEELIARVTPDPALPPAQALLAGLHAYVGWISEHREGFGKLLRSAAIVPEVEQIVRQVRDGTAARLIDGLAEASGETPTPLARIAVAGWLSFMDGAIIAWLEREDVGQDELVGLLVGSLLGALTAAGAGSLAAAATAGRAAR